MNVIQTKDTKLSPQPKSVVHFGPYLSTELTL